MTEPLLSLPHDEKVRRVAAEVRAYAQAGQPDKTMIKTMFKGLRFQEDWRGLKDPEAETDHWVPGLKQIELAKDWDLSVGGQVRYQLKDEIKIQAPKGRHRVIVDMGGVKYIDSSGLGALVAARVSVIRRGGYLKLARLQPDIQQLVHKMKLDQLFDLHPSVEAARSNLE